MWLIGSHSKHIRKQHNPLIPCKAGCGEYFPWNKDMFRHARARHRDFSADPNNGIPPEGGECPYPDCDTGFTRNDNLRRHVWNQHVEKQGREPPPGMFEEKRKSKGKGKERA